MTTMAQPAGPSVDVFTVASDGVPGRVVTALAARLTPDEHARGARFVREADRRTFVLGRALVRTTLSAYGPEAPLDWRFDLNAHGCPSVSGSQAGTPRLSFNLSHTRGLVALAVTRGHLVGIDVERIDRVFNDQIIERHFAASEVQALRALPDSAQATAFFEYWTLKEAYIKARGMGLAIPLDAFAFTLRPSLPPAIAFIEGFDDRPDRWQFWQAWPTSEHRLSLAIAREGADLPVTMTATTPEALLP